MQILSFDEVKLHKRKNEVHKHAELQELTVSFRGQPDWYSTKKKQFNKR